MVGSTNSPWGILRRFRWLVIVSGVDHLITNACVPVSLEKFDPLPVDILFLGNPISFARFPRCKNQKISFLVA
jgi:hypothetical protein